MEVSGDLWIIHYLEIFPHVGLVIFGFRMHKDFMNFYLMDSSCDDIYGDMEIESDHLFNHE